MPMIGSHTKAARKRISDALRGQKKTRTHRQRITEGLKRYHEVRRAAAAQQPVPADPNTTVIS